MESGCRGAALNNAEREKEKQEKEGKRRETWWLRGRRPTTQTRIGTISYNKWPFPLPSPRVRAREERTKKGGEERDDGAATPAGI